MSATAEILGVSRRYGATAAVDAASLTLSPGRIACLLGPSGCGKSTLLRLVAGLEPVDGGEIRLKGEIVSARGRHVAPEARDLGFVFQDYALFPHLTVAENVGFGLKRLPKAEREARVARELERVRLAHRAADHPAALSGGQQQRVALARALARDPALVLLDEPFSGLDGRLKAEVRDATLEALKDAGQAALIVTHDAEEAMMMADDLALMEAGRILQTGGPRDCYLKPASLAAARLLGEVNALPARREAGRLVTAFGDLPSNLEGDLVAARPEGLVLSGEGRAAQVTEVRFAGGHLLLSLQAEGVTAIARTHLSEGASVGETVKVGLDPVFCSVFSDRA